MALLDPAVSTVVLLVVRCRTPRSIFLHNLKKKKKKREKEMAFGTPFEKGERNGIWDTFN